MSDVPPKFAGLKIEHQQDELRISWPILNRIWAVSILLTPLFAFPLLSKSNPIKTFYDLWETLFLVLISLGLPYASLVSLLNRSVIQISQSKLEVKHGPLPYAFGKVLDLTNVRQIYVRQVGRFPYTLYILTGNNRHEKFLEVTNGKLALYLEQEIERFLGIEDQVIRGEWRPEPYLWE